MRTPEQAREAAQQAVEKALAAGAEAADAAFVAQASSEVEVRMGEVEDVSASEGEKLGLRVFIGQRVASVATSALDADALEDVASRAVAMARAASEDEYAGLAPQDMLLDGTPPDLDLDPNEPVDPAALKVQALDAEAAGIGVDGVTQSIGASATAQSTRFALATSHGFAAAYGGSGRGLSVSCIAGEGEAMERDYAFHSARYAADLDSAETVGRRAGERAVARLNEVDFKGGVMPVIYDPRVATSLINHLSGALNGAGVARRTSFLKDKMGERIFAEGVTIIDDPLRVRGLRSHGFDGEGLAVKRMAIVEDGVLKTWFAHSAAARQLGIAPTGHAIRGPGGSPGAGPSNIWIEPGARSREAMIAGVKRGFLATSLIGQGVNPVTGDYSRGASGFVIENGEIVGPVSGVTIAANLKDMYATLEPASDLEIRRGVDSPTLLVPEMTIATG